jgi:hypothetical protein
MAALSPGASLPLSGSTVLRIFLLWPDLLSGKWRVTFDALAGPLWGRARDARKRTLWMESCLEASSTTKEDGLSGIVPRSIYKMSL